jgi:hypothetical protein
MIKRFRHVQLLAVLTLLLLANPFAQHTVGFVVLDVLFLVAMISAVVACSDRRSRLVIGLSLILLVQAASWYRAFNDIYAVSTIYSTLSIVFFGYVTALVLRDVFSRSTVSADTICGALSAYLLLGVTWAFGYALLEHLFPGSIVGLRSGEAGAGYGQYLSYSFVTLTTLGYGNVVPGNAQADVIASFEAIVGQIYLTVLVARLVALNLISARSQPENSQDE